MNFQELFSFNVGEPLAFILRHGPQTQGVTGDYRSRFDCTGQKPSSHPSYEWLETHCCPKSVDPPLSNGCVEDWRPIAPTRELPLQLSTGLDMLRWRFWYNKILMIKHYSLCEMFCLFANFHFALFWVLSTNKRGNCIVHPLSSISNNKFGGAFLNLRSANKNKKVVYSQIFIWLARFHEEVYRHILCERR